MIETNGTYGRDLDESDRISGQAITFMHPDDVLHSRSLSVVEKRAILAAWASDAHAVPHLPTMRQLDSGATVGIDAVLAALRALDASEEPAKRCRTERESFVNPRTAFMSRGTRPWRRRDHDDDDGPPPSPVAALPPGVELELRRRRDAAWTTAAA